MVCNKKCDCRNVTQMYKHNPAVQSNGAYKFNKRCSHPCSFFDIFTVLTWCKGTIFGVYQEEAILSCTFNHTVVGGVALLIDDV